MTYEQMKENAYKVAIVLIDSKMSNEEARKHLLPRFGKYTSDILGIARSYIMEIHRIWLLKEIEKKQVNNCRVL